ncbi:MAG: pyridoxal 5-phosphate synthase pdxT subunit [Thermotogota bacterium]|nr:pyridoxal 5-phosphate synthase pdxT subunit [Thermotogota bacterium]MDK2865099.1 pyridoxal 5-phosphate synthase pdxT subunit [Thermotogota bacterium]HCZ06799.1 pyridoxal 5'-phosphate synthase glutaminase subunit PdxT [Thermotogota bacterium]
MKIGVLGMQGDIREHVQALERLGCETIVVKKSEDLEKIDGLVIPGGESTTITRLMKLTGIWSKLKDMASNGFPIFGTCAGLIVLAKEIANAPDQETLELLDVTVERNGYGRQIDSFEAELEVEGFDLPVKGVFIRAPIITSVGNGVNVLSSYRGNPVLVAQGKILAATFHPELVDGESRIHKLFIDMVNS